MVVQVLMERIATTPLVSSRTSSDVLLEHQQRKLEMLPPICQRWVATVATHRRTEMVRHLTAETRKLTASQQRQ